MIVFCQIILLDYLLIEVQCVLDMVFGNLLVVCFYLVVDINELGMGNVECCYVVGLMWINYVGEVCVQGLYFGQVVVVCDFVMCEYLLEVVQEEIDYLVWCVIWLVELDSCLSLFNLLWYVGSYIIGILVGLCGDGWNLGFVVEIECQVEVYLDEYLVDLLVGDLCSCVVIQVMKEDEVCYVEYVEQVGVCCLLFLILGVMVLVFRVMKIIVYCI